MADIIFRFIVGFSAILFSVAVICSLMAVFAIVYAEVNSLLVKLTGRKQNIIVVFLAIIIIVSLLLGIPYLVGGVLLPVDAGR